MIRSSFILACLTVALMSVGCCGPMGPGCGIPMGCNDCDGLGSNIVPAGGPLSQMRQFKRSLVCGSGCGEAYIGEWISSPPDAHDPCSGNQWVGGATKCRPFCWERGTFLRGLYGSRYCSGEESSASCGCGGGGCNSGGCAGGSCGGEIVNTGVISGGAVGGSSCGCASCSSGNLVNSARMAGRTSPQAMDARVNRIRR